MWSSFEGFATNIMFDVEEKDITHYCVLTNVACLEPWVQYSDTRTSLGPNTSA